MKLANNQLGLVNTLLVPLIISTTLLVVTIAFAGWAYVSRQDFKNNTDEKVAAAVEVAKKQASDEKDNEFLEREKFPLVSYQASAQLGSLKLSYPKTWSAYVNEDDDTAELLFNPKSVSADKEASFALRVEIDSSSYSDAVRKFDSKVENGELKSRAFSTPKVAGVVGIRLDGKIEGDKQGSVIILPLRDKSIILTNEVPSLVNDFNNIILPNLEFNP